MSIIKRVLPSLLAVGLTAVLGLAAAGPASAQSQPIDGVGNVYYLSGAFNVLGQAQAVFAFGDADDEVYFGNWYGPESTDLPMVRRGNTYFVPASDDPGATATVFSYGNFDDEVLVGDWDGDGVDTLAVRRGNEYFVKNDNTKSGVADTTFRYGDSDDYVLAGNWDGRRVFPKAGKPGKGDTLMVVRGNQFFVKNDLQTGRADYTFLFGNSEDLLLTGDWVGIDGDTVIDADGADQLAVRRGNTYFLSGELAAGATGANPATSRVLDYGDPDDAVFVAALPTHLDDFGNLLTEGSTWSATSSVTAWEFAASADPGPIRRATRARRRHGRLLWRPLVVPAPDGRSCPK